jgi:hypothetical protein
MAVSFRVDAQTGCMIEDNLSHTEKNVKRKHGFFSKKLFPQNRRKEILRPFQETGGQHKCSRALPDYATARA